MRPTSSVFTSRVWVLVCVCVLLLVAWPFTAAGAAHPAAGSPAWRPPQVFSPAQSSPTALDPAFANAQVALDLVRLTPATVTPSSTVTAEVTINNRGANPLTNTVLDLSLRTSRVTDRESIHEWVSRSGEDDLTGLGTVVASSTPITIPAHGTATVKVSVPASTLNLSSDETLWGPRRLALTVRSGVTPAPRSDLDAGQAPTPAPLPAGGTPLSVLRTFLIWQPSATPPTIDLAYLDPISTTDPALAATDPKAFATEASEGELADRLTLAEQPGVTPWIDPSLWLPLALPTTTTVVENPDPQETDTHSPQPSPSASAQPIPITKAKPESQWAPSLPQQDVATRLAQLPTAPLGQNFAGMSMADVLAASGPAREVISTVTREHDAPLLTRVPRGEVSADSVVEAARGAAAVLVPAESFTPQVWPAVTPSGYSTLTRDGTRVPLLGYDSSLTRLAENLGEGDTEVEIAQALAETSVIAGQHTDAPRFLLIAPREGADLDPVANQKLLGAFDSAAWVEPKSARDLVDLARTGEGNRTLHGGEGYLWPGELTSLHAVAIKADGTPTHIDPTPASPVDEKQSASARSQLTRITDLRAVLEDKQYANAAFLLAASSLSDRLDAKARGERLAAADSVISAQEARISLTTSPNYNLVAAGAGMPFGVTNGFDTPITVDPTANVSDRIVRVRTDHGPVQVPARQSVSSSIDVQALTSGTVEVTLTLTNEHGKVLESRSSSLNVNPDWENWSTLLVVIAMALLVIVGVIRAGRKKSDARAPAERGPEDLHSVDAPRSSHPSRKKSSSS